MKAVIGTVRYGTVGAAMAGGGLLKAFLISHVMAMPSPSSSLLWLFPPEPPCPSPRKFSHGSSGHVRLSVFASSFFSTRNIANDFLLLLAWADF